MFTLGDIELMSGSAAYERGVLYYEEQRVSLQPGIAENEITAANVRGSGDREYQVSLYWMSDSSLSGDCSCPVGIDCKHAVATALAWLSDNPVSRSGTRNAQARALNRWQTWLAQMPIEETDQPAILTPGAHYLLYCLATSTGAQATISFFKGYLKKDGSWSQLRYWLPDFNALSRNPAAFLQRADIDLLQHFRLLSLQQGGYKLVGPAGADLLQRLLASGKLIWRDDPYQMLRPGLERTLQWHWQEVGDVYDLTATAEGVDDATILPLTPPFYCQPATGQLGRLASDLSEAQVAHLVAMPEVPANAAGTVALQLRQHFSEQQLPLPVEPEYHHADTPQPRVRLLSVESRLGGRFPALLLSFDYGDCSVEPDYHNRLANQPSQQLEQNGQIWSIERDLNTEQQYQQRLASVRLVFHDIFDGIQHIWLPDDEAGIAGALDIWQILLDLHLQSWKQAGWQVEIDPSYVLNIQHSHIDVDLRDGHNGWFDFALRLPVGDLMLEPQELVAQWLEAGQPDRLGIPVDDGWVQIDASTLKPLHSLILDLFQQQRLDQTVSLPPFQAVQLTELDKDDLNARRAPLTRHLVEQLKNWRGQRSVQPPESLRATLRSYQQQGLNWLNFLHSYGFGGVLADDMGLGKTLQTLAFIQLLKSEGRLERPAMVLAPTSLMGNWLREAQQFVPELNVCLIHGAKRRGQFAQIASCDLVITSYPLLLRDHEQYAQQRLSLLVLDEAQAIKNPKTRVAQQVRDLQSDMRLCLTGTPLENHLGELWALMDFVLPGLLCEQKGFQQNWRRPIEQEGNHERQQMLAARVAPFMLRRTKTEVVAELPSKSEIVKYVELSGQQRELYEAIRISMEKRIRDLIRRQGMARSHIEFLDALLKLRQACIDPRLVKLERAQGIEESAKLDWLADNLPDMVEEGRRMLIFSQFTQLLTLVEPILNSAGIGFSKLTGRTRDRQGAIDRFQDETVPVFLISLKAGGSGLNLTAADTVIHLDPWWNPAVEQQATDRAYRIGQDKPVFVYKLVSSDTVEERILQMQQQKQALADALFDATANTGMPADGEALLALLSRSNN